MPASTTLSAILSLLMVAGTAAAQTPSDPIELHLMLGPSRSYGGYHDWNVSAAFALSLDTRVRSYHSTDVRIGFSLLSQPHLEDLDAVGCNNPRGCPTPFPAFKSAQLDVGLRRTLAGFAAGVAVRPGLTWIEHSSVLPSAGAEVELSRLLWGPVGIVTEGATVYLPWAHGERLGTRVLTFGVRVF